MKQKIKKEKKGCEATAKFLRVSSIVTNVPTQALCPFVDQKKSTVSITRPTKSSVSIKIFFSINYFINPNRIYSL